MARNIRWFVSFKSMNGTSCRVNIYDNDWPEGVTMGLRGADDAFYYEENYSNDILNDVVRYRTGYIRIVEEGTFGALDDIYPKSPFERYVEFYYGNHLEFNGYIQVQDFSNFQVPTPRVIELPVISPLGLFDKITFTPIMPPAKKTLGELLDIVVASGGYQKVTVPDTNSAGLWMTVFSLIVSPWNEDFHHSMNTQILNKLMKPKSYDYLIEGICKAFGWICHDTPQALVFSSFDHNGYYCYYPAGHIGDLNYKQYESISSSAIALTDYYTLADSRAKQSTLLPETGIEINYEGEYGNFEFGGLKRTYYTGIATYPGATPEDGERWSLCNLQPAPVVNEISSMGTAVFTNEEKIPVGNYCVGWFGHLGILCSLSGVYSDMETLFYIRYYTKQRTGASWYVTFDGMASNDGNGSYIPFIGALKDDDAVKDFYIKTEKIIYDDYVEVRFKYHFDNSSGSEYPRLPINTLIFIHNIVFHAVVDNQLYAEYRYMPTNDADYIPNNNVKVSANVTMPISLYRLNDHMIGDAPLSTKITEYPYLFQKRLEMEGRFRAATAQAPDLFHARLFSYLSKKWRLIAQTFHPWDDQYTLKLQHSPVLDGELTYTITAAANNTSLSGYSDTVNQGSSFNHILVVDPGYVIDSVEIRMGGVDITSTAYDSATGAISIASVTGNVLIAVAAVEQVLPYDAEVEYIQGETPAYIDTGIKIASNVQFDFDILTPAIDGANGFWFFGGRISASEGNLTLQVDKPNGNFTWRFKGAASGDGFGTWTANTRYRFYNTGEPRTLIISDGIHTYTNSRPSATFSTQLNFWIFRWNFNNSEPTVSYNGMRFYGGKMWVNGTLVRDYVAVRKNGVGYMYDKVSGELFGNANSSGSFSYGPDKNS